jgi:DNA polymerase-4
MDMFFVAVELRRRPELRGKPVVVATGTDPTARGVVMAASYEARKFGAPGTAPRQCRSPDMVLIPRDMEHYIDWSRRVMGILREEVARVEVVGLDEAYLDLGDTDFPKSECRRVKHRIREETGLVCSIGLAPNKFLAKIASDLDKPDGFCVLTPEDMLEAVGDRPASLIPGVGPKTSERLRRAGVQTSPTSPAPPTRHSRAHASEPTCATVHAASTIARSRPTASASRRAARRPSHRTCPTGT